MKTGSRIKLYLVEHHISQKVLAFETGIPAPKLNLVLNDKRRLQLDEFELILGALHESPDAFITPVTPRHRNTA